MRLTRYQVTESKRFIAISVLLLATSAVAQSTKQDNTTPRGWVRIGPQEPHANPETGREVRIDNVYFDSGDAGQPLVEIAHAIQKDATAARYRVTWGILFPNFEYDGTVVYDRDERSIKLYEFISDETSRGASHTLFTKVTDDLLLKFTSDYEAGKYHDSDNSIRSMLPKLGCNTYELSR